MPTVSVIIPTYNRAHLIAQTLGSVARQTLDDWECLVIDDGSTDDTADVVGRWVAQDTRFRYVPQANRSAASARNHGLRLAGGEFVGFLDSDDLFEPDKLAWQVDLLRGDPEAVLAYGETFQFHLNDPQHGGLYLGWLDQKPRGWAFEELLTCSAIYAPLVRTATLREVGGFDESLPSAEDWDCWLSLSKRGKLAFRPKIALRYRMHPGNKSGNTLRNYRCATQVARKHLDDLPKRRRRRLRQDVRAYFRAGYSRRLLREAERLTNAGDWPQARVYWRTLASLDPGLLLRKRHVAINAAWAAVPTDKPPPWRRCKHRLADAPAASPPDAAGDELAAP